MSNPERTPHLQAVLQALRTRTGQAIGYRTKPANAGSRWAIVYGITETRDGSAGRPADDATYTLQITCIGLDAIGADVMTDDVEAAFRSAPISVTGRRLALLDWWVGADTPERDTAQPELFYTTPRCQLWSTTA